MTLCVCMHECACICVLICQNQTNLERAQTGACPLEGQVHTHCFLCTLLSPEGWAPNTSEPPVCHLAGCQVKMEASVFWSVEGPSGTMKGYSLGTNMDRTHINLKCSSVQEAWELCFFRHRKNGDRIMNALFLKVLQLNPIIYLTGGSSWLIRVLYLHYSEASCQ